MKEYSEVKKEAEWTNKNNKPSSLVMRGSIIARASII